MPRFYRRHRHDRGRPRAAAQVVFAAVVVIILAPVVMPTPALGQGSVRAWGMGGAQTASARGLAAVEFNPANLAFSPGMTVGLVAAGADIRNNAFTLDRYNEITGATLTTSDKERLLADIPAGGLRLDGDLRASAIGIQSGSMAVSVQGLAAGRGNLDRDFFDLVLFGNEIGETVDFRDTHGEAYAVASLTFSYGMPVATLPVGRLAAGVNLRYLRGLYETHVEEASGLLTTTADAISGEARVAALTAEGGAGYAADLGFALQTAGGWTLGLALDNAASRVRWTGNPERHEFAVDAAGVTLNQDDFDAAVTDTDTTIAVAHYATSLPRQLRVGASRRVGRFQVAADWVQGLTDRAATNTTPRLNTGLEWGLLSFLQPRFGLGFGGGRGTTVSGGLGVRAGFWRLDLAALARGGLPGGSSRGLGFAAGTSLEF